jgi:hypothetical protein
VIVLPTIVGTVIAVVIFLPMSSDWATARAGEAAFWIFAAVGAFFSRKQPSDLRGHPGVSWADFTILVSGILVVRLMAGGIALVP